jgi:hypothetical protein
MSGWIVAFILLGAGVASSQPTFVEPRNRGPKTPQSAENPLLNPDRPSAYMEFVKAGNCPPANSGQKGERVWLAIRNNTRWTISVLANGEESKCYGDASPFYSVEANEARGPEGPIPPGYWFDAASSVEIEPGGMLRFSVPRTNLDPGLSVRVDFRFTWEKNDHDTRHSSYFSYWDLPQSLHDKAKETKLKCLRGPCFFVQPQLVPQPVSIPAPPSLPATPPALPDR